MHCALPLGGHRGALLYCCALRTAGDVRDCRHSAAVRSRDLPLGRAVARAAEPNRRWARAERYGGTRVLTAGGARGGRKEMSSEVYGAPSGPAEYSGYSDGANTMQRTALRARDRNVPLASTSGTHVCAVVRWRTHRSARTDPSSQPANTSSAVNATHVPAHAACDSAAYLHAQHGMLRWTEPGCEVRRLGLMDAADAACRTC